jgi:hypothetical protein
MLMVTLAGVYSVTSLDVQLCSLRYGRAALEAKPAPKV